MAGRVGKVAQMEAEAAARQQDFEREQRAARQRRAEEVQEQRQREEREAFMRENGLSTPEQCREFVRRKVRQMQWANSEGLFERWCRNMRQVTVDWLVLAGGKDDLRCLERLRRAGVIDAENRLVPLEERENAAARHESVRREVEEELRQRAVQNALDAAGQP